MIEPNVFLDKLTADLKFTFPQLHDIAPIHILGDGWGSIAVEGSNKIVFRMAKNEMIQELYKQQVKVLPFLATKLKKIEVPSPKYYVEFSERFPYGVMGYKKIEGAIPNPHKFSREDLVTLATQMAKLLLQFHLTKITREMENMDFSRADYSQKKLQETWNNASDWLRKNVTDNEYAKVKRWWESAISFFQVNKEEYVFVHGDPWYENIILDKRGNIKGIIDFDKVGFADRAVDFVVQQYISTEFMNMVIQQYQKLGGKLGNEFEKRVKLLSGIKRLEDLNYCLKIGYVYPNVLDEIRKHMLT
jgi:aminoglycoside phosphotransferase (APT) family kinase protein